MTNLITIGYEDVPFNEDYDKVDRKLVRTAIQDALESFIISKETLLLHEAPVFHHNGQTVIARLDGKEMSCNISGIHIAGIIEDFLFLPEGHPEKGEVEVEPDLRRSVVGDPLNIPEEYHWFDSMRMTSDGKLVYFWSDSPRSEISNTAVETVGDPKDKQKTTLSDFLAFLDGPLSPENMIVIMTTNHPDKIDPAILRRGRVNHHIEVKKLEYEEVQYFIKRNYGLDFNDESAKGIKITIADLQHYYLTHLDNYENFLDELKVYYTTGNQK